MKRVLKGIHKKKNRTNFVSPVQPRDAIRKAREVFLISKGKTLDLFWVKRVTQTELQNNCACVTYDPVGARRRENLDLSNTFLMKDQS